MKIIVGFGNTGHEYDFTRHNMGFLALDFFFKLHDLSWQSSQKFHSIWAKHENTIFLKPQTFYNEVGLATRECANFFKIDPTSIIAVCDDFNLDFGQLRFRERGSDGGNNGLKSLTNHLHTTDYQRLRIGTGNPELRKKIGDINFVLGRFTETERELLPQILSSSALRLSELISNTSSHP